MFLKSNFQVDSPLACEFINDISVGGGSMPKSRIRGQLSVWIVSNCGKVNPNIIIVKLIIKLFNITIEFKKKLFYRSNVSHSNPEGTEWIGIDLPDHYRASTVTCTEQGQVWVVTLDGNILLRDEINSNEPMGKRWIELESANTNFVSVAANSHLVFALDHQGFVYFREGLDEHPEGNKWTKVLMGLRSISLSKSSQVSSLCLKYRKKRIPQKVHCEKNALKKVLIYFYIFLII